jgi:hypothetical protein
VQSLSRVLVRWKVKLIPEWSGSTDVEEEDPFFFWRPGFGAKHIMSIAASSIYCDRDSPGVQQLFGLAIQHVDRQMTMSCLLKPKSKAMMSLIFTFLNHSKGRGGVEEGVWRRSRGRRGLLSQEAVRAKYVALLLCSDH